MPRMARALPVAMVGAGFMGRAHSNAWMSVNGFFDPPRRAVMHAVVDTDAGSARAFAARWGWAQGSADLNAVLTDDAVELVDVVTPNHLHAEHAIAALEAGKHVACEKPLARTLSEARAMRDAARRAKRRGARSFVWFNYRRCPAVAFARALVDSGKVGRIYHVRAAYLQDWGGPETPMSWRYDGKLAGSGAHGDLNAHIVDLARFVTGDEITEVSGALEQRFVPRRRLPGKARTTTRRSTVDDCVLFLARFKSGAVASFEATRLATGNLNRNRFEINGERGSLRFDFERMNELEWFDNTLPSALRGWSTITCTNAGDHPYAEAYWPPGHPIGYENQFVSQAADIIRVIARRRPVVPLPDFEDAYRTQRVLEAALAAARGRTAVKLSEIGDG
jgi:predicted dehydrogenase